MDRNLEGETGRATLPRSHNFYGSAGASPSQKYIATISGVTEVSLYATADLDYWQERLKTVDLFPFIENGRANILLSGVSGKWMALPFRELTISIAISDSADGTSHDGFYLAAAFNSSRLLAWCERAFFQTPYRHATLSVGTTPAHFGVSDQSQSIIEAARSSDAGDATPQEDSWAGKARCICPTEKCFTRGSADQRKSLRSLPATR